MKPGDKSCPETHYRTRRPFVSPVACDGIRDFTIRSQATGLTFPTRNRQAVWTPNVLVLLLLTLVFTLTSVAVATEAQQNVRLQCTPRTFRVVPGEPMRLELTVRCDSAARVRLHVPADPSLKLRAVEKLPVRRTPDGVIVYKRVVVWQALEPGVVKMDKLSVQTNRRKLLFPEVTMTVRDPGP